MTGLPGARGPTPEGREVEVRIGEATLPGLLAVPEGARGLVVFAHGSGSGRFSPRNALVACALNDAALATLLMDLLTPSEEDLDLRTRQLRFDIGLLGERVTLTLDWAAAQEELSRLPMGVFGASTGAAAALVAGAERPSLVRAVVSRGGRPDLAGWALPKVEAPTLLIVGELDTPVIALNREAYERMPGVKRMEIVPGATHLFEEPGKLEVVAELARDWFERHLSRAG